MIVFENKTATQQMLRGRLAFILCKYYFVENLNVQRLW